MSNPNAFSINIRTNKVCFEKHSPSARNRSCTYCEATLEQIISVDGPVAVNIYPCLHICSCSAALHLPGSTEHMPSLTLLIFRKPCVELHSFKFPQAHHKWCHKGQIVLSVWDILIWHACYSTCSRLNCTSTVLTHTNISWVQSGCN